MNLRFKKRWLYIFSNKRAQEAGGIGSYAGYIAIGLILGLILAYLIVTRVVGKFTP